MTTNVNQGTFLGTGICHDEEARAIGQRLFEIYGGNPGELNSVIPKDGVLRMLIDAYNTTTIPHQVEEGDIDNMSRVLDRNSDGRISLKDIEDLAVKLLSTNWVPPQSLLLQQQQNEMKATFLNQSQVINQSQIIQSPTTPPAQILVPAPQQVPVQIIVQQVQPAPLGQPTGKIQAGTALAQNSPLFSEGGNYFAVVNSETGQLELYTCSQPFQPNQREGYWKTANRLQSRNGPFQLSIQQDCNLAIYDKDNVQLWASDTQDLKGRRAAYLAMQPDGNLVFVDTEQRVIWASNTIRH